MADESIRDQLSAEIWRVVSSPYPVSLKALYDILLLDENGQALVEYSASNPCKLRRLAPCVLDIIEQRPFAIGLLTQLCASEIFRCHFLQLRPDLLDTLLAKAIDGHRDYSSICLQILRQSLPEGVPLPAIAEAYFVCVLKETICTPSAKSLAAAYDLLSGACRHLPQILPCNEWARLEDELIRIVKSSRTIQDQSLSLLCLGILRILACDVSSGLTSKYLTDAQAFFSGSKAPKSLSLAILQAAWVLKSSNGIANTSVMRSLNITFELLNAVPKDVLDGWSRSSDGQGATARLVSHCIDFGIHIDARLMLFSIVAQIYRPRTQITGFITLFDAFMQEHTFLKSGNILFSQSIQTIIPLFKAASTNELWKTSLSHALRTALCLSSTVLEMRNTVVLLNEIEQAVLSNPTLAEHLLSELGAINETEFNTIFRNDDEEASCNQTRVCNKAHSMTRRSLIKSMASLWLATLVNSGPEKNATKIGTSFRLLNILRKEESMVVHSSGQPANPIRGSTLVEQHFSNDRQIEGSWKTDIRTFVRRQAEIHEQDLAQLVNGICGELEKRCNNAETPFREAEKRAAELDRQVSDLRMRNTELDQQAVDLNLRLSAIEMVNAEVQGTLERENDRLIERASTLECALKESHEVAKAEINGLIFEHKTKELQLRTTIAGKAILVDELTSKCDDVSRLNLTTKAALEQAELRISQLTDDNESLRRDLNDKAHEFEQLKSTNDAMSSEMQTLTHVHRDTITSFRALQEECSNLREQAQRSASDHANELSKLEDRSKKELSRCVDTIEELEKALATDKRLFQERNGQLTSALECQRVSVEEIQRQQIQLSGVCRDQEKQIESLHGAIAMKDEEIAGFQAMRQTLASAIGSIPGQSKSSRKNVHYASSANQSPASRRQSKRLNTRHVPMVSKNQASETSGPIAGISGPIAGIPASESSLELVVDQNESTPKRTKPRKSFKVPVIHPPRLTTLATPRSAQRSSQRLPLTDISTARGNRSPLRQSLCVKPSEHTRDYKDINLDSVEDLDGLDFGSEIFTSTPFTPGPPVEAGVDEDETFDE